MSHNNDLPPGRPRFLAPPTADTPCAAGQLALHTADRQRFAGTAPWSVTQDGRLCFRGYEVELNHADSLSALHALCGPGALDALQPHPHTYAALLACLPERGATVVHDRLLARLRGTSQPTDASLGSFEDWLCVPHPRWTCEEQVYTLGDDELAALWWALDAVRDGEAFIWVRSAVVMLHCHDVDPDPRWEGTRLGPAGREALWQVVYALRPGDDGTAVQDHVMELLKPMRAAASAAGPAWRHDLDRGLFDGRPVRPTLARVLSVLLTDASPEEATALRHALSPWLAGTPHPALAERLQSAVHTGTWWTVSRSLAGARWQVHASADLPPVQVSARLVAELMPHCIPHHRAAWATHLRACLHQAARWLHAAHCRSEGPVHAAWARTLGQGDRHLTLYADLQAGPAHRWRMLASAPGAVALSPDHHGRCSPSPADSPAHGPDAPQLLLDLRADAATPARWRHTWRLNAPHRLHAPPPPAQDLDRPLPSGRLVGWSGDGTWQVLGTDGRITVQPEPYGSDGAS